jgi:predicted nucleic acid-binding protein
VASRKDVQALFAWDPLPVNRRVIEEAWGLQTRYPISWWDALIVSAALISDCRYLLTEDLNTDQKISSLKVIRPFQTSPQAVHDLSERH